MDDCILYSNKSLYTSAQSPLNYAIIKHNMLNSRSNMIYHCHKDSFIFGQESLFQYRSHLALAWYYTMEVTDNKHPYKGGVVCHTTLRSKC